MTPPRYRCDACGATELVTTEHWLIISGPGPQKHLVSAERLTTVRICADCKGDPYAESRAAERRAGR